MAESELHIDEAADGSLSVAPPQPDDSPARDDAGTDASIEDELGENADDDAKLDRGLDESMDASDTPSSLQPGAGGDAAPSSGYDEEAERQRDA